MKTVYKNIIYSSNALPFFITLIIISGLIIPTFAQDTTLCNSDKLQKELLQENPIFAAKQALFEKEYRKRVLAIQNGTERSSSVVYTIPVVIHIIHSGEAIGTTENPSDASLINSINVSSQRFRHMQSGADTYTNPNYGADTEIELCMANIDPSGNYTSGIVRYYDPVNTLNPSSAFLNSIEWDTDLYLNIFIATDIGGACGYYTSGNNDYTVFLANCYNTGLVAHELGHYFSLDHTFQGSCTNGDCLVDGDGVCDTPPKSAAGLTGACSTPGNSCTTDEDDTSTNNPYRSTALGGMGDQVDMLANYMDYTGSCWDCFTAGQSTRMRTYIDTNRANLKNNAVACSNTPTMANDAGIYYSHLDQTDICDADFSPVVTINNYGNNDLTSVDIEVVINSIVQQTEAWTGSIPSGESQTFALASSIVLPAAGTYTVSVRTSMPNSVPDSNTANDSKDATIEYFGGSSCAFVDVCEPLSQTTNAGPGNTTIINAAGTYPTANVENIQICVNTYGDFSYSAETMTIIDESGNTAGTTIFGSDCSRSVDVCFNPSLADYYSWVVDGVITITFDPTSSAINPNLCSTNEVCASIIVSEMSVPSCANDAMLTGPIISGTYEVIDFIICSGDISSPESVILRADNTIDFLPGFEVQLGAELDADTRNTGCSN